MATISEMTENIIIKKTKIYSLLFENISCECVWVVCSVYFFDTSVINTTDYEKVKLSSIQ